MTIEPRSLEHVQEFVIAGHGNLEKVKQLLAQQPSLLNQGYEWKPGDIETALQAAAHMGQRAIAEYLLSQGAPLDICTAAMLGRVSEVNQFLAKDSVRIKAVGAHAIPLLTHAALSDNVALVQQLWDQGAQAGASEALSNAVSQGRREMARWLVGHGAPDLSWENFQGKTVLELARERGEAEMISLLEEYHAKS